jgi:Spy/CpxP family protein refolding chaperone
MTTTLKGTLAAAVAALFLAAATHASAQPPAPPAPPAPSAQARIQQQNRAMRLEIAQARRLAGLEAAARVRGMQAERALLRGLQLSEAQRSQLREMARKRQEATRELSTRLREARQGMRQAQVAETLDESAIRRHAAAMAEAEAELAIARAHGRGETLGVLTPEQQKIVIERQQRLQERQQRVRQRLEEMRTRAQERAQQRKLPRI